jgi:hypothetical protein
LLFPKEIRFVNMITFSVLKYRAVVVFGLNELSGKTRDSQGAVGAWNSSDAESLIRYTVNKGYTIHGWELGKKSYLMQN